MSRRDDEQAAVDELLAEVARQTDMHIQDRTLAGMRLVMIALKQGATFLEASAKAGVADATARNWRKRYPLFGEFCEKAMGVNARARAQLDEARRREVLATAGKVAGQAPRPPRGSLSDFKMRYFGRPTPPHQELIHEALEDYTNLYVFIFGPPGMGKDTTAGDYCAWEAAPDTAGKTVAWFMESKDFSERRFSRLDQYLTDPRAYANKPSKTPGGRKPEGSLITDYGPFKWEAGMVWPDGSEVRKKSWSAHSKYFVEVDAPEQDPNLWATGVQGSTYGSRIKTCVCSDIFTKENQESPTERERSYTWTTGTLDTRLDDDGRLVVIGTMLPIENNYERLLDDYTEGARVVYEKQGPTPHSTLVKYSNGVAVVKVKAIAADPETGEETSFWPDMFPLHDTLVTHGGKKLWNVDELSIERLRALTAMDGAKLRRGLRGRRARDPKGFAAMYQQERERSGETADFTDEVLEAAKDEKRSFGEARTHELIVVGVDPARVYGASWVALAVDRREGTVTLCDFFWGKELGYAGMRTRLVVEPITKWNPIWYVYETNADGALLEDALIQEFLSETGVSIDRSPTNRERGLADVGPASIAPYMRTGEFRIPAATAQDRQKFDQIKTQFKAWDQGTHSNRKKPGQTGHYPDDIAMAAWKAWTKARTLLEDRRKDHGIRAPLPEGLRRKWDRMMKKAAASSAGRKADRNGAVRERTGHHSAEEAMKAMAGVVDDA